MRTSTIIGWFALSLPAQVGQDPFAAARQEIAEAVAVEEQEHDLGKAEGMLRGLLEKGTLSAKGKAYAALRLGLLLQRLGRGEEAATWLQQAAVGGVPAEELAKAQGGGGQDPERVAALRDKARTLIRQVLNQGQAAYGDPLWGIADNGAAEQLSWIGAAAVPEVVVALDAEGAQFDASKYGRAGAVSGLAGFLWRTGGDDAVTFLERCSAHTNVEFRKAVAQTAFHAEHERMLAVAQKFLRDPEPTDAVATALLNTRSNNRGDAEVMLENRLPADAIAEAALAGPVAGKVRLLRWARRHRSLSAPVHVRMLGFLREALRTTDPVLGPEAQRTLFSPLIQRSVAGLEVVFAELPEVPSDKVSPYENRKDAFTDVEVRQLEPALLRCAERLGDARTPNARHEWMRLFSRIHGEHVFDVATVLRLIDHGYVLEDHLDSRVTPQNAAEVFSHFDRASDQPRFLVGFREVELPSELFAVIRDKAEAVRSAGTWKAREWPMAWWATPMAQTGHPEAADWIVAECQREKGDWPARALIRLSGRNQDERVRAAMRTIVASMPITRTTGGPVGPGGSGPNRAVELNRARQDMMLALLRMSDVPALDLVHVDAPAEELAFLVQGKAEQSHRYTDDQVIATLRRLNAARPRFANQFKVEQIPDRVLCEIGRLAIEAGDTSGHWLKHITRRISDRAPESGGRADLVAFLDKLLASDSQDLRRRALSSLGTDDVTLCQPAIEARLNDDDSQCASIAFSMLCAAGVAHGDAWLQRGLKNQHAIVRARAIERLAMDIGEAAEKHVLPLAKDDSRAVRLAAANYFGSIVSKAAVPDLIAMLRDAEGDIRQAAADALTKIRFFHEQQAHWDRVLKGLDASPASAAEKLLLQSKPGAPRDQRLLALRSLGMLGRPEALPFLIEWSQDQDADIAAAARAATLQILQTGGTPAVK